MKRLDYFVTAFVLSAISLPAFAEGITSHVVSIDHEKNQITVEWHNETTRVVHWTGATTFSILETRKRATPADIRSGSFLRIQGEETEGNYIATEIVIWIEESNPES
jgi:hypothetical protein